ncbi:SMP-30/gluconolactonase/LRE family protein [Microcoleus vaginatus]|uniref:SMP-30/gluconolactonase/LRE family protein n=1 Tax=Microcoleus vaginatus TaxID=119532 RepID=UPI002416C919
MTIKIATISLLLIVLSLAVSNPSQKLRGNLTKLTAQTENKEKKNAVQDILDDSAKLEKVAGNFQFIEGPIWHPDGFLLFSDIPANIIYKLASNQQVEIFRTPSGKANGNTLDKENRLLTGEHENRRVSRTEKDGKVITLADKYEGKRLNSPERFGC